MDYDNKETGALTVEALQSAIVELKSEVNDPPVPPFQLGNGGAERPLAVVHYFDPESGEVRFFWRVG